jgi:hypothetical protein
MPSEVIAAVLAHHRRVPDGTLPAAAADGGPISEYRAESLDTLFSRRSS